MAFAVTDRGTTRTEQRPGTTTTTTSASFSPTAGALLVCLASGQISDSSGNSTFSISDTFTGTTGPDGTGTWHQDTVNWLEGTQTTRVSIFTAKLGASPGTGTVTLTFNYASSVNREFTLTVLEVTGQKTANFTNVNSTGNVLATSITVTMGSTPASSSLQVGVCFDSGGNTGNITKPTNWTEVVQKKPTSRTAGGGIHEVAYAIGLATSAPQWTTLSGAGNTQGAMAVEITIAPTPVSSSDTGSGSDSGSVSAAIPSSDTGSGTEGTPSVAFSVAETGGATEGTPRVAFTATDTGSGSDASALAASASSAETGGGAEGVPSIALTASESGAGADSAALTAATSSTDTGAGDEGAPSIASGASELASGAETGVIAAALSSVDAGAGIEATSLVVAVSSSDSGSSADAASVAVPAASSDVGAGVETASLVVTVSSSDAGVGAEAASLVATFDSTDAGAASDTAVDTSATLTSADTSSAVEAGSATPTTAPVRILGPVITWSEPAPYTAGSEPGPVVSVEPVQIVARDVPNAISWREPDIITWKGGTAT